MSKLFTKQQEEFIKNNVKGIGNKELTEKLNKKFKTNFTQEQIKNYKNRRRISSGLTGRFEKGNIPANKGKPMSKEKYEKCKATMFKKGNITYNTRPVGSERYGKDFYVQIKTQEPNKWELKHKVIYEKAHGKLEKGYVVIFADGDIYNFDIDNLIAIKRSELLIMNQKKLIKKDNPDLTKTGINIAKLYDIINKKNKTRSK